MIDTGQVLSAQDRMIIIHNRERRENDPMVKDLRRQIRMQRKKIADNDMNYDGWSETAEREVQKEIKTLKRKLIKRINQLN